MRDNTKQILKVHWEGRLLTALRCREQGENRGVYRPWWSHVWAGSGQQLLTSPSCPDFAPAYPWSFCGCKTPIFNDTELRRWKRWSRGQTHGSCEEDSPGHVRRRPGKELKWRPLRSRTELSASVRKSRKKKEKKESGCFRSGAEAVEGGWVLDYDRYCVINSDLNARIEAGLRLNWFLYVLRVLCLRTAAVCPRKAAATCAPEDTEWISLFVFWQKEMRLFCSKCRFVFVRFGELVFTWLLVCKQFG